MTGDYSGSNTQAEMTFIHSVCV